MIYDHILDKRQLRQAFERAAASYDQSAVLQREVCERMLSRLDYIKYTPDWIMDIGSGTGYGSRKLSERYPRSHLVAVDIALAMHRQARPPLPPRWQQWLPLVPRRPPCRLADQPAGDPPWSSATVGSRITAAAALCTSSLR